MKIFHHHTIHHCSACAHCTNHDTDRSDVASFDTEMTRARPSIVGALAGVVQLAGTLYLLHVDRKRTAARADADQDATAPIQTATEAVISDSTVLDDVIGALFADAAHAERGAPKDDNAVSNYVHPPRGSLAAAFLAAFRGQPTSA